MNDTLRSSSEKMTIDSYRDVDMIWCNGCNGLEPKKKKGMNSWEMIIIGSMGIWVFPKIGVPQIIHLFIGFSIINHPFWGKNPPIFGSTPICTYQLTIHFAAIHGSVTSIHYIQLGFWESVWCHQKLWIPPCIFEKGPSLQWRAYGFWYMITKFWYFVYLCFVYQHQQDLGYASIFQGITLEV